MPPKRTSTSATPAMTEATIRQVITEGVATALEAQASAMAYADNPNRNTEPREIPVVKEETTQSSLTVNLSTLMTDGEAMINSIQNGDHPLPVIAQVSLAGTAHNAPPTLKDPKF
uniref:Reverse transcriptase domain-containing protein n=1 Tax=Tanacetum cinerariifolium TaxID=118510 RepID=A0A699GMP8_TANCI|nr:hypothetical protein [Tanacetum cinerariifolium]